MKFRFHKGGYEESMATEVQVNSMAELQAIIQSEYPDHTTTPTDIRFEYCKLDPRNGWDTWYVMGTLGDEHVIGMSDAGSFD